MSGDIIQAAVIVLSVVFCSANGIHYLLIRKNCDTQLLFIQSYGKSERAVFMLCVIGVHVIGGLAITFDNMRDVLGYLVPQPSHRK